MGRLIDGLNVAHCAVLRVPQLVGAEALGEINAHHSFRFEPDVTVYCFSNKILSPMTVAVKRGEPIRPYGGLTPLGKMRACLQC